MEFPLCVERPASRRPADALFVAAHPDDTETMLGYSVLQSGDSAVSLVATDGTESTVNHTAIPDFVIAGQRRQESVNGLQALGVKHERQVYLGLQDGDLERSRKELAEAIVDVALERRVGQIFTLGNNGFDGHPDHVSSHQAAVLAVKKLHDLGSYVSLLGLSSSHDGRHAVEGSDRARSTKLHAMSSHTSQFPIWSAGKYDFSGEPVEVSGYKIEPGFWNDFQTYHPLIMNAETFDAAH